MRKFTCQPLQGWEQRPPNNPQPDQGRPQAQWKRHGVQALPCIEWLIDDLDAVELRVKAAGLTPFSQSDYAPGRRFYFLDPDGIEYEVVSYAPA